MVFKNSLEIKKMAENIPQRLSKLEIIFDKRLVYVYGDNREYLDFAKIQTEIDQEVWDSVVLPEMSPLWHDAGKDEMDILIIYTDGSYLCQKKRLKYDYATKSNYWAPYEFKEATGEQIDKLLTLFETITFVQKEVETHTWLSEAKDLINDKFFYDSKYYKRKAEISKMLLYSDWRMLPDAPQLFEGERELWKIWREKLRNLLPPYEEIEDNYEVLKVVALMRYPIDPRVYYEMYPNLDVEYLSTDDQYLKRDFQVSKDFVSANILNVVRFAEDYEIRKVPIEKKSLELIKKLELEKVFPGIDYERYYVIDDE